MKKVLTTRKELYARYGKENVFAIGYCVGQHILRNKRPESYCSGVYGWNCDNYVFYTSRGVFVICTGYRPYGTHNSKVVELVKEYDDYIVSEYESFKDLPLKERSPRFHEWLTTIETNEYEMAEKIANIANMKGWY